MSRKGGTKKDTVGRILYRASSVPLIKGFFVFDPFNTLRVILSNIEGCFYYHMNKTFIGTVATVLILGGIMWIARPDSQTSGTAALSSNSNGTIEAEETNFNFGTISMAGGKVRHQFKIRNASNEPVTIEKMYTSCMCTTAILMIGGKQFGPYGMAGHGFIPNINRGVNAGEEIIVEATFDPAAHGPAGVGRIQRSITVENNAGRPLEFGFTAFVTP